MSTKRKLKAMQAEIDGLQAQIGCLVKTVTGLMFDERMSVAELASMDYEPEPKLKTLDQSVFYDEHLKWAATDADSQVYFFERVPVVAGDFWVAIDGSCRVFAHCECDATDWQNSLIEREGKKLTGSDLAKAYFKRGCCPRICFIGEDNDECLSDLMVAMVIGYDDDKGFETSYHDFFPYATLVNSYGDELTAIEVGL